MSLANSRCVHFFFLSLSSQYSFPLDCFPFAFCFLGWLSEAVIYSTIFPSTHFTNCLFTALFLAAHVNDPHRAGSLSITALATWVAVLVLRLTIFGR